MPVVVIMIMVMIMIAVVTVFVVMVVHVVVVIVPVTMSMIVGSMAVIMRMPAMRMIGSSRRLEGLVDLQDRGPQPLQHGTNDMIAQDDDAVFFDLGGKMAVAEMPGELDQMCAVASANFEELLVGRKDLDQFAVIAHQQVAIGEKHRVLEIEHDHLAIFQMQELAAKMAQIMRQLDLGGRMGRRGAGGKIGDDALHDMSVLMRRRPCKIAFPDASTNSLSLAACRAKDYSGLAIMTYEKSKT